MSFEFDSQFDVTKTVHVKITVSNYDDRFPPTNIINNDDYDPSRRWVGNGPGTWIDFQLDQDMTIYGLDIAWYRGNERTQTFKILSVSSPNTLWHGASALSSGYQTYRFNQPIRTSNIRLIGISNTEQDESISISAIKFRLEHVDTGIPPFPECPPGKHWHEMLQRCVDDVIVDAPNVVIAEPIQTVKHGERVVLDGSQSNDPNGSVLFFEWSQTGGEFVAISNPLQPNILFVAPTVDTELSFRLTVKNEANLSASADAKVIVKALMPECPPGTHYDPIQQKCVDDEPGCPDLPDDGRNQFHKGGNKDPTTWTIVAMRDDPDLFKIVDNNNVNIADLFHTEQAAQQFIAHYICDQPEPPSGDVDEFGIKKIYEDTDAPNFYKTTGGGDIEQHGDYRREWEIQTPPYENIEITGQFRVNIEREDTISIKPKGAKHTGSEPQYSACCNIHYVPFSGTGKYIGKQCPHLNYKELDGLTPKFTLGNIRGKWIGVKAIEWNEGGNVHWQTWIDENVDNNWRLWIDFVELNCSIGDDSDTCPPFTKSPWAGSLPPTILMRVDFPRQPPADDVEARYLSARTIKPPTSLPDPIPNPPSNDTPYPIIGQPLQSTQRGPTTRHYASGKPDDNTIEKNVKNIKFKNYQFVADITNDCGWSHDDTFSMKLGGTHMGTGWFDNGIGVYDGQCCLGTEKNHPSTQLCVIKGSKIGDTRGKRFKMATAYFTDLNKVELWTDFGNGWVKQMEGVDVNNFNPRSSEDECQLRIDGFKTKNSPPTIHSAIVTEISDSQSGIAVARAKSQSKSKGKTVSCGDDLDR